MITCRVLDNVHHAGARPTDSPTNVMDLSQGVLWVRGEKNATDPKIARILMQGRSNVLGFVRSLPFSSRNMSFYRSNSGQKWLALDAR